MLGNLSEVEIEHILHEQVIGRIGCHADGRTYVVPVTYAYDGGRVICHSREGMKIRVLRKNPLACFEVERIKDLTNWQSVIVWGTFEELSGPAAAAAMGLLVDRLAPVVSGSAFPRPHGSVTPHGQSGEGGEPIAFCLNLLEKSGRFERNVSIR